MANDHAGNFKEGFVNIGPSFIAHAQSFHVM